MNLTCPGCRGTLDEKEPGCFSCGRCRGLWLSAARLISRGAKLGPELVAASNSAAPRTCPTCRIALGTYRSKLVEIDACDRCTGVYLDRGELEILLAATAPARDKPGQFVCARCGRHERMGKQVIGERETVCRSCAGREAISHAPEVRRRALANPPPKVEPASASSDDSGWETAGTVALGALEVAFDLLDIF